MWGIYALGAAVLVVTGIIWVISERFDRRTNEYADRFRIINGDIAAALSSVEKLRSEFLDVHEKLAKADFHNISKIEAAMDDIQVVHEKAKTAEMLAHSAKMDYMNPRKIELWLRTGKKKKKIDPVQSKVIADVKRAMEAHGL